MPDHIPIDVAKGIAESQGCSQVILLAWDGTTAHVVTYGKSIEDCAQAAEGGNRIKQGLGWPDSKCHDEPERVIELRRERDAWEETAARNCRDAEYYRSLVVLIGQMLGPSAYVSDDGSVQTSVLCAKVPELVRGLVQRFNTFVRTGRAE
jgi:hypothetical protein